MTSREAATSDRALCADCGDIVPNWDFYDPDNLQNVAGIPVCNCRARRLTPKANDL
ncbi:MAG: hypothetical protein GXY82_02985 [Methanospirillum sp.]|nr:hypothetical protein [Methanospirillum sp.]